MQLFTMPFIRTSTAGRLLMTLCIFCAGWWFSYHMNLQHTSIETVTESGTSSHPEGTCKPETPACKDTAVFEKPEIINLLSWTDLGLDHGRVAWFPLGTSSFSRCKTKCNYSHNPGDLQKSHVILFRGTVLHQLASSKGEWSTDRLPSTRLPHQKWLFYETESQAGTGPFHPNFRYLFNATATFKRDADINMAYGTCEKLLTPDATKSTGMAEGRTKLVAWFVSHCYTKSQREDYVKELSKHIPITIEGRCGTKAQCSRFNQECSRKVRQQHKFYLSFENNLCTDYYTEKIIDALLDDVVPIVYGLADYEGVLPPKSYIDVQDFSSPRHLADYLKIVDLNDTLYDEYFAWKRTHRCFGKDWKTFNCKICEYFHEHFYDLTVVDLQTVWSKEKNCIIPKKLYLKEKPMEVRNTTK